MEVLLVFATGEEVRRCLNRKGGRMARGEERDEEWGIFGVKGDE
jgi:hypothetical protein